MDKKIISKNKTQEFVTKLIFHYTCYGSRREGVIDTKKKD